MKKKFKIIVPIILRDLDHVFVLFCVYGGVVVHILVLRLSDNICMGTLKKLSCFGDSLEGLVKKNC